MELVLYPDPILREKAQPIAEINGAIKKLAEDMIVTMHQAKGVGLAGPQVGVKKQIIIVNPSGEKGDNSVYINPKILKRKGRESDTEGCLSLPKIFGTVMRSTWIEVAATLLSGEKVVFTAEGFRARVIQHEVDHLLGILFISKIEPTEEIAIRSQLKELEKRYEKKRR